MQLSFGLPVNAIQSQYKVKVSIIVDTILTACVIVVLDGVTLKALALDAIRAMMPAAVAN